MIHIIHWKEFIHSQCLGYMLEISEVILFINWFPDQNYLAIHSYCANFK